ncbi:MAG TPA: XcyI family restriction endonuclease, partial [Chloroflexota bacterium]|nr:XcyI family restriction endonuclease [Chloroflexota bacterium]
DARAILAGAGIRDEYLFPTPAILIDEPRLVGYYRLLLGRPQKSFYGADGFGMFKGMETNGTLNPRQRERLPEFCSTVGEAMGDVIRQMSPAITMQDVSDLPLLILGSQFQGMNNNLIGQRAIHEVFTAVQELVEKSIIERTERSIVVKNAAGRRVRVSVAADPDIRIQEEFEPGTLHNKVALEIKGGTDASNAHNRAGEAEKSHQTATKENRFEVCWTLIALKGVDFAKLRTESPTTQHWFDIAEVLARKGTSWDDFRRHLAGAVGIRLSA